MQALPHWQNTPIALAPMAGITDRPFRALCRVWGASFAVSEMLSSDTRLWDSRKSRLRMDYRGESGPRIVQIAGAEPAQMAIAAQQCVARGAQFIDINMGCPAKKVCRRAAGSALLADEPLVAEILQTVVRSVDVPVTLKFRTGPDRATNNAVTIAQIAEQAGIAGLALHGRSRADAYRGQAEYETIARVKRAVGLPVLANGDVMDARQARHVLNVTGADGLLIGRGAQGRPWLFAQIHAALGLPAGALPDAAQQRQLILDHMAAIHDFYGPEQGLRVARKHIGWYLQDWPDSGPLRSALVRLNDAAEQLATLASGLASIDWREAA